MRAVLAIVLATAMVSTATADLLLTHAGHMEKSGGGGGCTNSMNFSQACNSFYLAVIH